MAYSVTKFVWNFVNYCDKGEAPSTIRPIIRGKPKLVHKVVMELSKDIERKWHVIAMDNFFTYIDPYLIPQKVSKKIHKHIVFIAPCPKGQKAILVTFVL